MSNFKIKFKEIFLPIAVVSILVISFYNLIRWYFDIKFGPIPLNREILDVGIPIVLPWVFILIFLRKKIRILNIAGRRDNGHMLFQILVSSLMFVPIMISRNYLTKSVYSLIEVENSIDIKDFRKEKYFSIKNFELNEKKILVETSSKTSKSDLILYTNFLYPINEEAGIYYGLDFNKTIRDPDNREIKELEFRKFYEEKLAEVRKQNLLEFEYLEKLFSSEERSRYFDEWKEDNTSIVLVPRKNKFEDRISNGLFWIFGSFGIIALLLLGIISVVKIDEDVRVKVKANKPYQNDDFFDIVSFLNPFGEFKSTAIIIVLSVLLMLIILLSGGGFMVLSIKDLINFGGSSRGLVGQENYWRLFTAIFVYNGFLHLVYNLLFVGFIGYVSENIFGSVKFMLMFIVFGIGANLANIYWNPNMIAVGSFGSISGFIGLQFSFAVLGVFEKYRRNANLMFILVFVLVCALFYWMGMINLAILISGFLTGILVGLIIVLNNKGDLQNRINDDDNY